MHLQLHLVVEGAGEAGAVDEAGADLFPALPQFVTHSCSCSKDSTAFSALQPVYILPSESISPLSKPIGTALLLPARCNRSVRSSPEDNLDRWPSTGSLLLLACCSCRCKNPAGCMEGWRMQQAASSSSQLLHLTICLPGHLPACYICEPSQDTCSGSGLGAKLSQTCKNLQYCPCQRCLVACLVSEMQLALSCSSQTLMRSLSATGWPPWASLPSGHRFVYAVRSKLAAFSLPPVFLRPAVACSLIALGYSS